MAGVRRPDGRDLSVFAFKPSLQCCFCFNLNRRRSEGLFLGADIIASLRVTDGISF